MAAAERTLVEAYPLLNLSRPADPILLTPPGLAWREKVELEVKIKVEEVESIYQVSVSPCKLLSAPCLSSPLLLLLVTSSGNF